MSSLTDEEGGLSSNQTSAAALPSFKSVRNDSAASGNTASSESGSRRSGSHSPLAFGSHAQDRTSFGSATSEKSIEQQNEVKRQRTRQRGSGGFLLEHAFPASRLSRTLLSRSHNTPKDIKGKRKSDGADLFIPKRRVLDARQAQRASVGSSPLATKVRSTMDLDEPDVDGIIQPHEEAPASETSPSSSRRADSVEGGGPDETTRVTRPSMGFDTDPAQIVSMALSLSEGRRRQASGMRAVSGRVGGNRIASGLSTVSASNTEHTGSIAQFLTPQRQSSRNVSPRPDMSSPRLNGGIVSSTRAVSSNRGFLTAGDDFGGTEQELSFTLSEATVKRIQKAKNFFELAYEHRRLLPHLPPIRTPGVQSVGAEDVGQSKIYNPLQYVRNRKLRFREKNPIAAEAEGWHDIWQVRTWVDAVISTHHETRHDPDECVRLPDLALHKQPSPEDEEAEEVNSTDGRQASVNQTVKPKRPRSDWETHPGDFIADAFWLEQGLNKTKIEDNDGNPIYPPNTHFKFSGWRNRAPIYLSGLQEHTPPPESISDVQTKATPEPTPLPDLPTFQSAKYEKKGRKDRGRAIDKIRGSIAVTSKDGSSSRKRRERIMSSVDYSSDSSTDSNSGGEVQRRGRNRISRKLHKKISGLEGDIFNGIGRTSGNGSKTASGDRSLTISGPPSKRASMDSSRLTNFFIKESSRGTRNMQPSHSRSNSTRRDSIKPRMSQDSERAPRTSAEYDTTAPSSPAVPEFPSIAINLSPPQSRSPSPTKRVLQSKLNPFRDRSKQREGISATDFAQILPARGRSAEPALHEDIYNPGSRDPSPMTRDKSPMSRDPPTSSGFEDTPPTPFDRNGSTVSRMSTRSGPPSSEGHNKIRGIFKGGRIAELVGNEVSRVGDFIWKRDAPSAYKARMSNSTTSFGSHHDSDTEEDVAPNGTVLKTPPQQQRKRFPSYESVQSDRNSLTSKSPPSSAERQYNNPNLPVFTSPAWKETQEDRTRSLLSPQTSPEDRDHISRLAEQHRLASKSPRLTNLAPPRLDTSRPTTPPAIIINGRRDSYGFGSSLDLTRSRSASQMFNNNILDRPDEHPATGLSGLKASRSGLGLSRAWNASDLSLANSKSDAGIVTHQDIARAAALLNSSAFKAREICLRADMIRDPVPKFLLDTIEPSNPSLHSGTPLKVPRREEHVVAARNLISKLSSQAALFQTHLRTFSKMTTPHLHTELQRLEDMVENAMTPRVRMAADQAGELSMKLATTNTLAVKALNDSISSAFRRRRRGTVRWMRRVGYKLIEWGVVGLLWGIWLVVTLLHGALSTVTLTWAALRWLVWMD